MDAAQKLNEAIARGARRPMDRPPDPELHPRPNGGYVYEGLGFDATIDARGNVDMHDRYGTVHVPLVPFRTASGEWRIAIFGGTFRLFEWARSEVRQERPVPLGAPLVPHAYA